MSPSPKGPGTADGANHNPANPRSRAAGRCDGKGRLRMTPSAPRASPDVCSLSALLAPWPCLFPASRCMQQAGYGCPTGTTLVFLSISAAPEFCRAALWCPTCPRTTNPSLCISLPATGTTHPWQWVPSHHTLARSLPISGGIPPASCSLGILGFPKHQTHACTHTHTHPCSLCISNCWVRLLCLGGSSH